jgi:hypothetical protein
MLSPSSQEASSQEERSWEGRLSPPSSQQALLRARTEPEMGIKIPLEGSQGIQKTPSFPGETALRPPNKQELPKGPSNPTNIFPDLTGFGRTPTLFQGNNPHPRQSQSQSLSLSASEESLSFSYVLLDLVLPPG